MSRLTLSEVKEALNKKFGEDSILSVRDSYSARMERVSTGILPLDICLGGGLAYGKISLLYGREASGKSTLALKIAKSFQETCRNCRSPIIDNECPCDNTEAMIVYYVDLESKLDSNWADKLGVDIDKLLLSQAHILEEAMDAVELVVENKVVDLVIFDSIAAAASHKEVENSMENLQMGEKARLMNKFFTKLTSAMKVGGQRQNIRPTAIFINQPREKIGIMFGNPETLPGGKGQNFASTQKIRLTDVKMEEGKNGGARYEMKWKIEKNSAGGAIRNKEGSCKMWVMESEENKVGDTGDVEFLFKQARQLELVVEDNKRFTMFGTEGAFSTQKAAKEHLENNKKAFFLLRNKLVEIICGETTIK